MPFELQMVGPRKTAFKQYEEGKLRSKEVRLKSIISGISHGTEMSLYRGTNPFLRKRWHPRFRIFTKDRASSKYPVTVGYECVSEIAEAGEDVASVNVGDIVWSPTPHRETNVISEENLTMLPDEIELEEGIFIALARVALNSVHDAKIKVGDNVAVFGLGTIGLVAVQLARSAGAFKVFGVDLIDRRLDMAEKSGAIALNPKRGDVAFEIKKLTGGKGVDVAIESSGTYKGLHDAIRSCCMAGRVVALGFYQGGGSDLYLGEEWHHNRVTMLSSMAVWDCPHRNYPMWNLKRLTEEVINLFKNRKVSVRQMITHKIPFREAERAYRLIDEEPQTIIKVALTYA